MDSYNAMMLSFNDDLVLPAECYEVSNKDDDDDHALYSSPSTVTKTRAKQLSNASSVFTDDENEEGDRDDEDEDDCCADGGHGIDTCRTATSTSSAASSAPSSCADATPAPFVPAGISGETLAMNINRMRGFPTDAKIAEQVYPLHRRLRNKYMVAAADDDTADENQTQDGMTHFAPTVTEGKVLKIFVQRQTEASTSAGCVHSMNDNKGRPYAGGATLLEVNRTFRRPDILLRDGDERPVALCKLEFSIMGVRTYGIYGTRPLLDSKPGTPVTDFEETFYPWFQFQETRLDRLREEDNNAPVKPFPGPFNGAIPYRRITVWNGRTFEPMWRAYPGRLRPKRTKKMRFQDRDEHEEMENTYVPNTNEILLCNDAGTHKFATLLKYLNVGWQVTVGPGVDPAAVLCVTAIMDESLRDNIR